MSEQEMLIVKLQSELEHAKASDQRNMSTAYDTQQRLCEELTALRSSLAAERERADNAEAELNTWFDYWGCESPHDSYVQASAKNFARQLGIEQVRANQATNKIVDLERQLAEAKADSESVDWLNKNWFLDSFRGFYGLPDTITDWRVAIPEAAKRERERRTRRDAARAEKGEPRG